MDPFNKVHIFEPTKSHIYEPNISLISLMFNYSKPRLVSLDENVDWRQLCGRTVEFCRSL